MVDAAKANDSWSRLLAAFPPPPRRRALWLESFLAHCEREGVCPHIFLARVRVTLALRRTVRAARTLSAASRALRRAAMTYRRAKALWGPEKAIYARRDMIHATREEREDAIRRFGHLPFVTFMLAAIRYAEAWDDFHFPNYGGTYGENVFFRADTASRNWSMLHEFLDAPRPTTVRAWRAWAKRLVEVCHAEGLPPDLFFARIALVRAYRRLQPTLRWVRIPHDDDTHTVSIVVARYDAARRELDDEDRELVVAAAEYEGLLEQRTAGEIAFAVAEDLHYASLEASEDRPYDPSLTPAETSSAAAVTP